ncbi:MAG TPA: TetR/AcrR family transcriptional regulator [Sporichthya sp.]|jgi:AcrR family transcriptional regulator|nr:TetR/AcrR family transcriptional regulator [Sporichthya sp.]
MAAVGPKKASNDARERVLDATAKLLKEKGYASLRLRDVGTLTGFQAGSLYYYIESKDQLVEDVLMEGLRRVLAFVRTRVDEMPASATPFERLTVAVASHLEMALEITDYSGAYIGVLPQLPEDIRARVLKEEHRFLQYWHRLISDAQEAGQLRKDIDARAMRILLVGALNAAAAAVRVTDAETWTYNATALLDGLVARDSSGRLMTAVETPAAAERRPRRAAN